jgi:hypothetical protein
MIQTVVFALLPFIGSFVPFVVVVAVGIRVIVFVPSTYELE